MLQVSPISREVIDLWPIAEAGLPARVINSVGPAGVATVGNLRKWADKDLLALRSLGRISVGHIHSFFRLCNQIEQGKQRFSNIREALSIFLDGPEFKVISARYGFERTEMVASRDWATLQEIGNAEHKTRERIRQVQDVAIQKLGSRLAAACLQPFCDMLAAFIRSRSEVITCSDLIPLAEDPMLAGFNICSILLLLSDRQPGRITFHHGLFSTLSAATLQSIESQAMQLIGRQDKPMAMSDLLAQLGDIPGLSGSNRQTALAAILDHVPQLAATTDGRHFLLEGGTNAFLVEIMKELPRPTHYRTVTKAFNERVKSLSRKGAGFILEALNANPQCTRVDRGIYDLKAV